MNGKEDYESKTRGYYDSSDADLFYRKAWCDEHIHQGIFSDYSEPMERACTRTVQTMAEELGSIGPGTRVLDIGSGYGGTARYLAGKYGCHVSTLNLSELQNSRSAYLNSRRNLNGLIDIAEGSFEDMPFEDSSMDVCWSIDAILHSGDRKKVIQEISRVLRKGGDLIFTDPMVAEGCPEEILGPILDRISLETMGSLEFYREEAQKNGLEEVRYRDFTEQLVNTYSRVLDFTEKNEEALSAEIDPSFISHMKEGLRHWVNGGKRRDIIWGIMHFRKA